MSDRWRWPDTLHQQSLWKRWDCTNLPGTIDTARFRHVQARSGVVRVKPDYKSRDAKRTDAS